MWLSGLGEAWKLSGVLVLVVILSSCGGGGGGDGDQEYTVSGTLSGLEGDSLEFYIKYRDAEYTYTNIYQSDKNENFTLDVVLPDGVFYSVGLNRMPENPKQHCIIENTGGVVSGANVTDLNISCYKYKNITVTVSDSRFYDTSLSINIDSIISPYDLNEIISVKEIMEIDYSASGDVQVYSAEIIAGSSFDVSVLTVPYPQDQHVCYVNESSGVVSEDDINIKIDCMKAGSVGGSVIGLEGGDLVINNGGSTLTISEDGQFIFPDLFPVDSSYEVSIVNNPDSPKQLCRIDNGTGILPDSINQITVPAVTDLRINCYGKPVLNASSLSREVVLDWPDITADRYNVYYSSDKNFNPANYAAFPDGAFLQDVTSPLTVSGLDNKKGYYFVLEAEHSSGLPYSEKAGARPDSLVVDGGVNSVTTNDAGDVYVGGHFTKVRAASGQGVPLSIHNRSLSIANYPMVNGKVTASVSDGAGGWYIGGDFTVVGGAARGKLAHILADGSLDALWHPDVDGVSIEALYYLNGVVYVGGSFTTVDGNPHQNFVAIAIDGSIKPWNLDADGVVHTFTSSGSVMYMGGYFTTVGGVARSRIAAFDHSGVLTNFDVDITGGINCMQAYNNRIYIAGRLDSIEGISAGLKAVALDLDGIPTGWDSGNRYGIIEDLLVHNDIVYFSGQLLTSQKIAAIHVDGKPIVLDSKIDTGYAYHLEVVDDMLLAAGDFSIIGNYQGDIPDEERRYNMVAYNLSASTPILSSYGNYYEMDFPIHRWNPAIDSDVTSLSVSGGAVYAGGEFNGLGGAKRNYLMSINADGSLSDWNPSPNGTVKSIVENNGTVYVGGSFSEIGSNVREGIAAIDSNGEATMWSPLITGLSVSVNTLFKDNDTLYIGGLFTGINGQSRSNLASMLFDGSLLGWSPDVNGSIKSIAKNNSNLYIGGDFSEVNGLGRRYIASFDSAGDLTNWAPDITNTFNGWVYPSVNAILPVGNNIYFAGHFTSVNGASRNHAAAVDESGVLTSWDPNISHSNQLLLVNSLAYHQNGIVIGGKFSGVGANARRSLALVGEDGLVNAWDPDVNGAINVLHVSGSRLYGGGVFSGLGSGSQSNLISIDANGVLQ